MPRVPIYDHNTVPLAQTTQARFRPADNAGGVGGAIAQGFQEIGGALDDHAQTLARIQDQRSEQDAKDADVRQSTAINAVLDDPQTGIRSLKGKAAVDAYEPAVQALKKSEQDISGNLKTSLAQRLFRNASAERIATAQNVMARHVAVEQARSLNDTSTARIESNAADAVSHYDTPDAAERSIATMVGEYHSMGQRNGDPVEVTDWKAKEAVSGVRLRQVDRQAIDDPVSAGALLEQYRGQMTGADLAAAERGLHGPLTERAGIAAAEVAIAQGAGAPVPRGQATTAASNLALVLAITPISESGRRDFTKAGAPVTSPKGAKYAMQVMPSTAHDPGYGIAPVKDESAAEYNRVGTALMTKFMQIYHDPAKAWAAYNWSRGGVDKLVARHGDDWAQHLPAKETRDYVHRNMAMLGGPGSTAGAAAPARADLEGAYQRVKDQHLPFEVERAALAEVDRRVSKDDQMVARAQSDAKDAAYKVIDGLGGGFTSVTQLSPQIVRNLSPEVLHSFRTQAEQNAAPKEVPANGPAITNLHQLVNLNPEAFRKTDLRTYQPYMTRGEYDQIGTLQSAMLGKANSPAEISHSRIWSQINFYGRDIGIDMSAKKNGENDTAFTKRRQDGMALFTVMQNYLSTLTEGKRQPTDDEIKKAFDNAVIPRRMADGTVAPRFRDTSLPSNSVAVPQAAHDVIARGLRARGLPHDDQHVALVYMQGK